MDMIKRVVSLSAICLCAVTAQSQQVEYVTRTSVGHAVAFGSSPIRATTPRAYVSVNNGTHAVRFGSNPITARLPRAYVTVNNGPATVQGKQRQVTTTAHPQTYGPRSQQGATDKAESKPARETPSTKSSDNTRPTSRHMLRVMALMNNKLDCHR